MSPSRFGLAGLVAFGFAAVSPSTVVSQTCGGSDPSPCHIRAFPSPPDSAVCTPSSPLCADGILDPEVTGALDLDGQKGPDLLSTRRGAAILSVDRINDGSFDAGGDGFRDAGLRCPDLPGFTCRDDLDCLTGSLFAKQALSGFNTGKLTVVYFPDSDQCIASTCPPAACAKSHLPCSGNEDCQTIPGDSCGPDDSVFYVGQDIFNGFPYPPINLIGDDSCGEACRGVSWWRIDFEDLDVPPDGAICNEGVADYPRDSGDGVPDMCGGPFDVDADGSTENVCRWNGIVECTPGSGCGGDSVPLLDSDEEKYRMAVFGCGLPTQCLAEVDLTAPGNGAAIELTTTPTQFCENGIPITDGLNGRVDTFPRNGVLPSDLSGDPKDVEYIVYEIDSLMQERFPGDSYLGVNRFRLAEGSVRTFSNSLGDSAGEDKAAAVWSVPIPEMEVTKKVRCGSNDPWGDTVDVLPGTVVEFKIEVENTGNVPLFVTLEDTLASLCVNGLEAVPVGCETGSPAPGPTSLQVTLNSPSRGIVDRPITIENSKFEPGHRDACDQPPDPFNCNNFSPGFFFPFNDKFLCDIKNGDPSPMGVLNGVDVCSDPQNPTSGDKVTIMFKAILQEPENGDFCSCTRQDVDVRNGIKAIGDPDLPNNIENPPPPGPLAQFDRPGDIDTPRETAQGFDDNVVTANVLCREIVLDKKVGPVGGPLVDKFNVPSSSVFPLTLEYAYTVTNNGETPEMVTLTDDFLCNDIADSAGVSAVFGECDLCLTGPFGQIVDATPIPADPSQPRTYTCKISFDSEDALNAFLMQDDDNDPVGHADCQSADNPEKCYKNCASVTATPVTMRPDAPDICGTGTIGASDSAEICFIPCELKVCKQVRCLNNCEPRPPSEANEGWMSERVCSGSRECCDDELDCPTGETCDALASGIPLVALPGDCVEYRVIVRNASDAVPICALQFDDLMPPDERANFVLGPNQCSGQTCNTTVRRISGPECPSLESEFNWDGDLVCCELATPLAPDNPNTPRRDGGALMFTWRAEVKSNADSTIDPTNSITVGGTSDCIGACSDSGAECDAARPCPAGQSCIKRCDDFSYTCPGSDSETIVIRKCEINVTKEVSCDEPRLPEPNPSPPFLHPFNDAAQSAHSKDTLPGSMFAYKIEVKNTGDLPLEKIKIKDELSEGCTSSWYVTNTVACDIDGANVTPAICGNDTSTGGCPLFSDFSGTKIVSLLPGQTLRCTLKMQVPDGFMPPLGTPIDCENTTTITPDTPVCGGGSAPNAGCEQSASAKLDVLVPKISCQKRACKDHEPFGSCDTTPTSSLRLDDDGSCDFPTRVIYELAATNTGEVPLVDVKLCDPALVDRSQPFLVTCSTVPDSDGCFVVAGPLPPGDRTSVECTLEFVDENEFSDYSDGDCHTNTLSVSGTPRPDPSVCPSMFEPSSSCSATVCGCRPTCVCDCLPKTKAVYRVWNEFESKFSGAERCVGSWDARLLSRFSEEDPPGSCGFTPGGASNFFGRPFLRTDKGKARIDAVASPVVCGDESVAVPLLGVAEKLVFFNGSFDANGNYQGEIDRSGMSLVGIGAQAAQINWDIQSGGIPPAALSMGNDTGDPALSRRSRHTGSRYAGIESTPSGDDTLSTATNGNDGPHATISSKGSLIVFPRVEIKWNGAGEVIQDTFLDLANDYPNRVRVQMFFVNGDCCVWLDNAITLTGNQSIYWSALTGDPRFLSPFTELSEDGRTRDDADPTNAGGHVLRGYILAWAVDPVTAQEISWNHLKGDAVIVNYAEGAAWEYNTWNFRSVVGTSGSPLLAPFGQLDLDGQEYDFAPDELLLDFYASGATFFTGANSFATIDTDVTLLSATKDLRLVAPPAVSEP